MLSIDYRDGRPIYEQIKDGIKGRIISGVITPDERLPSVRNLSSSLAINPNTIQKAYSALEKEGFAYAVAGKGMFASKPSAPDTAHTNALMQEFKTTVDELLFLGVTEDFLINTIRQRRNQRHGND